MFDHNARSSTAAALFSATLMLAVPFAANAAEVRTVTVQSSDLNLAKDAGRAVLQHRIARAVDEVCGPAHARTTAEIQAYATCSHAARASAMSQFNAMVANVQTGKRVADRNNAVPAQ